MQHRIPDSLPKSDDSALSDKLECLYNLLYLLDRFIPSAGPSAENPQLQQHQLFLSGNAAGARHRGVSRAVVRPAGADRQAWEPCSVAGPSVYSRESS